LNRNNSSNIQTWSVRLAAIAGVLCFQRRLPSAISIFSALWVLTRLNHAKNRHKCIINDLSIFQVWWWHFLGLGRSSPSFVFWLFFNAVDLDQCVFVCVPVVSGKNRKLCALISPAFHLSEQLFEPARDSDPEVDIP
jgi:hypothetical protein